MSEIAYKLHYEDTSQPVHKRKATIVKEFNKLKTWQVLTSVGKYNLSVLWYLIKRHQVDLLIAVVCLQFALFIYIDIMR